MALARATQPFAGEARRIAASFDPDDWPFIALALEYGAPIWTNDRDLIRGSLRTGGYRALDTRGLEMLLNGVSWEEIRGYLRRRYCGNP
ncbi:MAG: PIN domain-containing protein [Desulfurococcales archaeon]|nr:PIN domain-containing protein [Desulfurococcales archaeon]